MHPHVHCVPSVMWPNKKINVYRRCTFSFKVLVHACSLSISSACRQLAALCTLLWEFVRWCTKVHVLLQIVLLSLQQENLFQVIIHTDNSVGEMALHCGTFWLTIILLVCKYYCSATISGLWGNVSQINSHPAANCGLWRVVGLHQSTARPGL